MQRLLTLLKPPAYTFSNTITTNTVGEVKANSAAINLFDASFRNVLSVIFKLLEKNDLLKLGCTSKAAFHLVQDYLFSLQKGLSIAWAIPDAETLRVVVGRHIVEFGHAYSYDISHNPTAAHKEMMKELSSTNTTFKLYKKLDKAQSQQKLNEKYVTQRQFFADLINRSQNFKIKQAPCFEVALSKSEFVEVTNNGVKKSVLQNNTLLKKTYYFTKDKQIEIVNDITTPIEIAFSKM